MDPKQISEENNLEINHHRTKRELESQQTEINKLINSIKNLEKQKDLTQEDKSNLTSIESKIEKLQDDLNNHPEENGYLSLNLTVIAETLKQLNTDFIHFKTRIESKKLIEECVEDIQAHRFRDAITKIMDLKDKTDITRIIKSVYDNKPVNFNLIMPFSKLIEDVEIKFLIINSLEYEMELNGDKDPEKILELISVMKFLSKNPGKEIATTSKIEKLTATLKNITKDKIILDLKVEEPGNSGIIKKISDHDEELVNQAVKEIIFKNFDDIDPLILLKYFEKCLYPKQILNACSVILESLRIQAAKKGIDFNVPNYFVIESNYFTIGILLDNLIKKNFKLIPDEFKSNYLELQTKFPLHWDADLLCSVFKKIKNSTDFENIFNFGDLINKIFNLDRDIFEELISGFLQRCETINTYLLLMVLNKTESTSIKLSFYIKIYNLIICKEGIVINEKNVISFLYLEESVRKMSDHMKNTTKSEKILFETLNQSLKNVKDIVKDKIKQEVFYNDTDSSQNVAEEVFLYSNELFEDIFTLILKEIFETMTVEKIGKHITKLTKDDHRICGFECLYKFLKKIGLFNLNRDSFYSIIWLSNYILKEVEKINDKTSLPSLNKKIELEGMKNGLPDLEKYAVELMKPVFMGAKYDWKFQLLITKFREANENLYTKTICTDIVRELYDVVNTNLLLTRVDNWTSKNTKLICYINILDKMKEKGHMTSQIIFEIANKVKHMHQKDFSNYQKFLKLLPLAVKYLVFSDVVCIRSLKFNEYLYAANFHYGRKNNNRRRVLTWIPGDKDEDCRWLVEKSEAFGVHDHFYFININHFHEYLYLPTYDYRYDWKRRYVFTWSGRGPVGKQGIWKVELAPDNKVYIKNVVFGHYIFPEQNRYNYDHKRRQVFACHEQTDYMLWRIEDCSRNRRKRSSILNSTVFFNENETISINNQQILNNQNGPIPILWSPINSLNYSSLDGKLKYRKKKVSKKNLFKTYSSIPTYMENSEKSPNNINRIQEKLGQKKLFFQGMNSTCITNSYRFTRNRLPENGTQSYISSLKNIDTNSTLLFFDLIIRKITGKKFVTANDDTNSLIEVQGCALQIAEKLEEFLSTNSKLLNLTSDNYDTYKVYKKLVNILRKSEFSKVSSVLTSDVIELCPGVTEDENLLGYIKDEIGKIVRATVGYF